MADSKYTHSESSFTNSRKHEIYTQNWVPASPKALIFFLHGFGDHSSRHTRAAQYFAENGYAVFAHDYESHGKSKGASKQYFDRYSNLLEDFNHYFDEVTGKYKDLPRFLFGISMGGGFAVNFIVDHKKTVDGVILLGSGVGMAPGVGTIAFAASKAASAMSPHKELKVLDYETFSTDPEAEKQYKADPLVWHEKMIMRPSVEVLLANNDALKSASKFKVPYLFFFGDADKQINPKNVAEFHKKSGSEDKTLKTLTGEMHDLLTGKAKDTVLSESLAWFNGHVKK
jgi:acylglycerol lipase